MKNTGQNGQIWMHAFWEDGDGDIGMSGPGSSPGGMVLAPRARQAFLECFAGPAA